MIDILTILLILGYLFVPALILTLYTTKTAYGFIGYLSIFMFVATQPSIGLLPDYFMYVSILIVAVFLYKVVVKND